MLTELQTFITVVECSNFTHAAQILNLSQPAVSMHIKSLEQKFHTILILRSIKQKNICITPAGRLLYQRAKQLLKLWDDTDQELNFYNQTMSGKLLIGATLTIGEYFLPALLGDFHELYPQLNLQVHIENTEHIIQKLRNLQLDIGLIEGDIDSNNLDSAVFYRDNLVLIAPCRPSAVQQAFIPQVWQQFNWITRESGSGSRKQLEDFLRDNNMAPVQRTIFSTNFAVKEAVKYGLGVSFISEHIAQDAATKGEVSIIPTAKTYFREFKYVLPKGLAPSKAIVEFIRHLQPPNQ